jgi:ClpP class serine protease
LIKKIGVERRVYTAGTEKDRLDPFLPQNPGDIEKIAQVIKEIHDNFKEVVVQGRQGKLVGDTEQLFNGDFWSGKSAVKLGLIDGLGNLRDVMRTEFNVSRYKDYTNSGSVLRALAGQMGASMSTMLNESSGLKVMEKI